MYLLYPSSPLRARQPDEQYAAEVEAVRAAGLEVSLFSLEGFQGGEFCAIPTFPKSAEIVYRGWMLSEGDYGNLASAVSFAGAELVVSQKEYIANHHLPNWYGLIADLTPETRIYSADCDLEAALRELDWPGFFIKDYVKSLKTATGSLITTPEQVSTVVAEMRRFRGFIEGGVCVRRIEDFLPETERRYFVLDGVPHAAAGEVPAIVHECAKRLRNRFYSVDVAERADRQLRIIEIGDGQVSDLVGWTPERFANILVKYFMREKPSA